MSPTCTAAASRVIPCDLWIVTAHVYILNIHIHINGWSHLHGCGVQCHPLLHKYKYKYIHIYIHINV